MGLVVAKTSDDKGALVRFWPLPEAQYRSPDRPWQLLPDHGNPCRDEVLEGMLSRATPGNLSGSNRSGSAPRASSPSGSLGASRIAATMARVPERTASGRKAQAATTDASPASS